MKNKIYLLTLFTILLYGNIFAQQTTVNGTVKDSDGVPIAGANILLKGSTKGTTSDFDGKFMISAAVNDTLVISYIGFTTQNVIVKSSIVNVTLQQGEKLDEVVVTALGIKREKRSLDYSVQQVKSDELLEGNQTNVVNGLQGKVAGVTVVNSGGAPGSSSIILIRGGTSITNNNQPLIVVDGIPIDNSTNASNEVASMNRAADINPEDIESVSVLKGPSAAILYGIQAANGAVLITTKKGKAGASSISYSGNVSIDNVLGTPNVQNIYGQGDQNITSGDATQTFYSWGNAVNAGTPTYNHIKDFYTTAITQNHNVSYSGGSEKNQIYMSVGDFSQNGIIKGTDFEKTSFKIKGNTQFSDKLTLSGSANYITTKTNSTKQGNTTGGSFRSLLYYPTNVDINDYYNEDGTQKTFYDGQEFDNPYWSLKNSPNTDRTHRLIGIATLNYNPFKGLNISYKLGTDYYNEIYKRITGSGTLVESISDGYISQTDKEFRRTTSNLVITYDTKLDDDFSLNLMAGNTVEDQKVHAVYNYGDGFLAPGIYSINNVAKADQSTSEVINRKRTVGVFGEAKFGWKDALFLNATARNDWSSTLPADERSFFYPSIGTSAIITDLFRLAGTDITSPKGLSYMQLRATWAKVGKDAPPNKLESLLNKNINSLASDAYAWDGITVSSPGLQPEFTTGIEIGLDSRFFQNKLRIDLSYYNNTSKNQILNDIRVPPTTGTFLTTLNGGSLTNSGFEALVDMQIFKTQDFSWNSTLNFGANNSKVNDLPGTLPEVYLSDSWTFMDTAAGAAILNGYLFGLRGNRPVRNDDGQMIIQANGLPELEVQVFDDVNRVPKWTLGFSNNFNYKNFGLSFLVDVVQGNDVYNATKSALSYYGLASVTKDRDQTIIFDGVHDDGTPNTTEVTKDQSYYQNYYSQNAENFIEDGSFVRLRYITISYKLPQVFLNKLSINSAKISLTARNLFTITNYSGVDPEVNTFGAGIGGAGSMGIDNLGTPSTKGFDLGLKFNF
ncbi:SusC/RagA family TonB-linked outer membrane protein [Zhouia sp. PK063]|uniref:SusC/RagA family TonB-linked outer membrane protein n=1 Tax=Zhouia sp. PK063 TaxID=3373602 RepID=UPI0037B27641